MLLFLKKMGIIMTTFKISKKEKNMKKQKIFEIMAIILIALFCISITPKDLQNDTFYTIKIGEHIKNFGIDMMDPFSWHEDLSYTYPHWLYDLCTYLVYGIAGFKGIYWRYPYALPEGNWETMYSVYNKRMLKKEQTAE